MAQKTANTRIMQTRLNDTYWSRVLHPPHLICLPEAGTDSMDCLLFTCSVLINECAFSLPYKLETDLFFCLNRLMYSGLDFCLIVAYPSTLPAWEAACPGVDLRCLCSYQLPHIDSHVVPLMHRGYALRLPLSSALGIPLEIFFRYPLCSRTTNSEQKPLIVQCILWLIFCNAFITRSRLRKMWELFRVSSD